MSGVADSLPLTLPLTRDVHELVAALVKETGRRELVFYATVALGRLCGVPGFVPKKPGRVGPWKVQGCPPEAQAVFVSRIDPPNGVIIGVCVRANIAEVIGWVRVADGRQDAFWIPARNGWVVPWRSLVPVRSTHDLVHAYAAAVDRTEGAVPLPVAVQRSGMVRRTAGGGLL